MGVLAAGCTLPVPVRKDPFAAQRAVFVGTELARTEFPVGLYTEQAKTQGYSQFGQGGVPMGMSFFLLPDSYGIQNAADFYLKLFAKQGHSNLALVCNLEGEGNTIQVWATAWNGTLGYKIEAMIGRGESTSIRLDNTNAVPGLIEMLVQINISSSPKMLPPSAEEPVHSCPFYSMERMESILKPFGLRPFDNPSYMPPYTPLGNPDPARKDPPFTWPTATTP
jgi:hypothetical protein